VPPRVGQNPLVHHLAAEHLHRDELYEDLLRWIRGANLGFQSVLDRDDVFAGV
jgi:hypothetical protein